VTSVDGNRYPFEIIDGVPVMAAPEEIDITNAPSVRSAMLEAAAHGGGTLVVDMTLTQFCDSSGLHALLAAHKSAKASGGRLLVVAAAPAILRIFALTGVGSLIPRFSSLNDALAHAGTDGYLSPADGRAHEGSSAVAR
jgi:anti-sigma B factor antagonist